MVVADDNLLVREGVRALLGEQSDMDVVGLAADLPELKMQITVKAAGKPLFDFPFTVSSLGPYESKDFSAPVQTTLKGYELPDWQFLKADFEITSQP